MVDSLPYLAQAGLSWGAMWIVMFAGGMTSTSRTGRGRATLAGCALGLGTGALLTSIKATDVMRMLSLITPVAIVWSAAYLDALERHARWAVGALVVLLASNVTIAVPETLFTGSADGYERLQEFYWANRWRVVAVLGAAGVGALVTTRTVVRAERSNVGRQQGAP